MFRIKPRAASALPPKAELRTANEPKAQYRGPEIPPHEGVEFEGDEMVGPGRRFSNFPSRSESGRRCQRECCGDGSSRAGGRLNSIGGVFVAEGGPFASLMRRILEIQADGMNWWNL